jgi:ATP-binding cassette subfamily B protein
MKYLLRLKPFLLPYRWQVLLSVTFLLGQTALNLILPYIIRQVIDVGLGNRNSKFLIQSALIILGIGVVRALVPYGLRYVNEYVAAHIGYDLRNRLYNHIQNLPFAYHDSSQAGQLISRCIEDVRSIERFTGFGVIELIRIVLLAVGVTTLLLLDNARLAWIGMLPLLPMIWITFRFGKKVSSYFLAVDNALGEISTRLQENVSGAQVVRAFAREDYERDRFRKANRTLYSARVRVMTEFGKMMPTTAFLVTTGTLLILWFGGQMVMRGELTVGELVAFNSYLLLLSAPVQQLAWLVNLAGEAVAGVQRAFDILDTVPEIRTPENAVELPALNGRVEFQNVHFHYNQGEIPALKEIDITIEPNQVVALIGQTGSGKTSLVNLIPRFYDASEGAVLVDGVDVRKTDLTSLRRQIGIVLQTSLLFSTSIRENIAYGRPDASLEEVTAAAQAAQAHEFILQLSEGYETVVGERGITLSGGQRQRIAIARALLMNPRILILDDSTSSVDTQTERLIQQALDTLMQGRTTFVIAHRLSTVRRADVILVLDHGRLAERGTNSQLLAQDGLYRQIYELQLRDQEQFHEQLEALEMEEIPQPDPTGARGLE